MKEQKDRYEIFLKVCETGSFSKAAEALNYTQSGISQMMAGLEEELGVQLFARVKRGVSLTDNGARLIPYIQEMVNQKDKLRQAAFNINNKIEGKLRVGSFSSITALWMPDVVHFFRENYPKVDVEIFDYLLDQPVGTQKFRKTLNFAGNLAKSKFLYKLCYADLKYDIDLFGVGFDDTMVLPNNIKFRGSFSPNDLPYKMNGGFGLVWDGESIESCTGLMGEYTQWNNPHKLSLYIAAGLPIFAWNKAAISDTIKKYDIGFCVDSLEEINYIMNNLTEERYLQLILNLAPLKKMVSEGKFLEKAIDEVVNVLKSKNY